MPGLAASTTVVLWDIDNTLLYTGGAGSLAMARAFRDVYGVEDAFRRVEFSGRTDTAILTDALTAHAVANGDLAGEIARFTDAYIPHLHETLGEVTGGRLMPGVAELLKELATREGVVQGLGTGNFRRGGALKLLHYGIEGCFPGTLGGFGEDSASRDDVIAVAIKRLAPDGQRGRVVVIGDTPHDVAAARANGTSSLAVATGRHTVDELRGAGADETLEDLSDIDRVLAFVRKQ